MVSTFSSMTLAMGVSRDCTLSVYELNHSRPLLSFKGAVFKGPV